MKESIDSEESNFIGRGRVDRQTRQTGKQAVKGKGGTDRKGTTVTVTVPIMTINTKVYISTRK